MSLKDAEHEAVAAGEAFFRFLAREWDRVKDDPHRKAKDPFKEYPDHRVAATFRRYIEIRQLVSRHPDLADMLERLLKTIAAYVGFGIRYLPTEWRPEEREHMHPEDIEQLERTRTTYHNMLVREVEIFNRTLFKEISAPPAPIGGIFSGNPGQMNRATISGWAFEFVLGMLYHKNSL
jgi:hypothetical protein